MGNKVMGLFFRLPFYVEGFTVISQQYTPVGCLDLYQDTIECESKEQAEYVAHALNTYDEMADKIKTLESKLDKVSFKYGNAWYDGFMKAKSVDSEGIDIQDIDDTQIIELSEHAEVVWVDYETEEGV